MSLITQLSTFLAAHPQSVLIELTEVKGSSPREAGTFMLVSERAIWGTIGGGQFEYMAIDNARAILSGRGEAVMDIPLGPEIGQCCGGRTRLSFAPIDENLAASLERRLAAEADERPSVFLFGSGHVGLALARALLPLPFAVTVIETRAEALEELPSGVARHLSVMPEAFVEKIPAGGAAIILTHDHALDFLIASEALARDDLTYTGMIGSATKRATFSSWLRRQTGMETGIDGIGDAETMLSRLVLPVGGGMVKDKRPEVIAAMVAAELLMVYAGKSRHPSQTKIAAG